MGYLFFTHSQFGLWFAHSFRKELLCRTSQNGGGGVPAPLSNNPTILKASGAPSCFGLFVFPRRRLVHWPLKELACWGLLLLSSAVCLSVLGLPLQLTQRLICHSHHAFGVSIHLFILMVLIRCSNWLSVSAREVTRQAFNETCFKHVDMRASESGLSTLICSCITFIYIYIYMYIYIYIYVLHVHIHAICAFKLSTCVCVHVL